MADYKVLGREPLIEIFEGSQLIVQRLAARLVIVAMPGDPLSQGSPDDLSVLVRG